MWFVDWYVEMWLQFYDIVYISYGVKVMILEQLVVMYYSNVVFYLYLENRG